MITNIAINGAAGRMGKRLVALGAADRDLKIVAALEAANHPRLNHDAGTEAGVGSLDIPLRDALPENTSIHALIDFSSPQGATVATQLCIAQRIPLVMATTGLPEDLRQRLTVASRDIPIVCAPNMSLAVNLTMKLAEYAASVLKSTSGGADVEIIERHHRFKEDAPSGTALKFGEIIANVMGQTRHAHGREGQTGKRPQSEIGYHALRVGDNPGEHTIVFGMLGESIELTVGATSRDCYALGALQAARFVAQQKPGLYNMYDVLGLGGGL